MPQPSDPAYPCTCYEQDSCTVHGKPPAPPAALPAEVESDLREVGLLVGCTCAQDGSPCYDCEVVQRIRAHIAALTAQNASVEKAYVAQRDQWVQAVAEVERLRSEQAALVAERDALRGEVAKWRENATDAAAGFERVSDERDAAHNSGFVAGLEWARKNCTACGGSEIGIPTGGGDYDECDFCVKVEAEIARLAGQGEVQP